MHWLQYCTALLYIMMEKIDKWLCPGNLSCSKCSVPLPTISRTPPPRFTTLSRSRPRRCTSWSSAWRRTRQTWSTCWSWSRWRSHWAHLTSATPEIRSTSLFRTVSLSAPWWQPTIQGLQGDLYSLELSRCFWESSNISQTFVFLLNPSWLWCRFCLV